MHYGKRGTLAEKRVDPKETARLLKLLHIRMAEMIDSSMKDFGLTASQCNVLGYILEHGDKKTNATDIHQQIHLSKASISVTIKKLRQKGFLEIRENPQDDRQKQIVITEKAQMVRDGILNRFGELQARIYCGISDDELCLMTALLIKMLSNLSEDRKENKTW